MEIIDYQELAYSRMTDQHKQDPAFVALVSTLVELKQIRQQQYLDFKDKFLDIDASEGSALDIIGAVVGQPRALANFITEPYFGFKGARNALGFDVGYWYSRNNAKLGTMKIVNDEQYRRLIKARIKNNKSRCTRDELLEILNLLTNDNGNEIKDVRHGVFQVNVSKDEDGLASYFLSKHKDKDTIFSIPLGYRISIAYKPSENPNVISCDGATQSITFPKLSGVWDIQLDNDLYDALGRDIYQFLTSTFDTTFATSKVSDSVTVENLDTGNHRFKLIPVENTTYENANGNPTFLEHDDGTLTFCLAQAI